MDKSKQIKSKPTSPKSEGLVEAAQVAAPKKEKTTRKPRKPVSDDKDIPEDLRGKRVSAGRPSNAERTTSQYLDNQLALLAADLLADIRKNYKKIPIDKKGDFLCKILPHLTRTESEQDSKTLSMELLGKKYLDIKVKIHDAEEATRVEAATRAKQEQTK